MIRRRTNRLPGPVFIGLGVARSAVSRMNHVNQCDTAHECGNDQTTATGYGCHVIFLAVVRTDEKPRLSTFASNPDPSIMAAKSNFQQVQANQRKPKAPPNETPLPPRQWLTGLCTSIRLHHRHAISAKSSRSRRRPHRNPTAPAAVVIGPLHYQKQLFTMTRQHKFNANS